MQPPSKAKTWKNEQTQDVDEVMPLVEDVTHGAEPLEGGSDDEYQVVSKKSKRALEPSKNPARDSGRPVANSEHAQPPEDQEKPEEDVRNAAEATEESIPSGGPVSDADWLRSRTSRLLGLEDDKDESARPPVEDEDGLSSDEVAGNDVQRKDTPKSPEPRGGEHHGQDVDEEGQGDAAENAARATGRLFLRNLPYDVSEDDLRSRFQSFGSLQEVRKRRSSPFPFSFRFL